MTSAAEAVVAATISRRARAIPCARRRGATEVPPQGYAGLVDGLNICATAHQSVEKLFSRVGCDLPNRGSDDKSANPRSGGLTANACPRETPGSRPIHPGSASIRVSAESHEVQNFDNM